MNRLNFITPYLNLLFIYLWSITPSLNGKINFKPIPFSFSLFQKTTEPVNKEISPWAILINNNTDALKNIYLIHAVKINHKAEVLSGNSAIQAYYKNNPLQIDSTKVLLRIDASPVKVYEMGKIFSSNHKTYAYLQIWDSGKQDRKIELEFIEEFRSSGPVSKEINKARLEWIRLCNQHDASKLIDHLYTENALYYNHKPMITGRKSITQEYSYMNNGNYHLKLEPIRSEMINENLVFEIGQCSGNYGGKYMIVWRKTDSGVWQVLMDSNI